MVIEFLLLLIDVFVIKGIDDWENSVECYVDDNELFFLFVFKIVIDFFVGLLIFICVYFGVVNLGDVVYNLVK